MLPHYFETGANDTKIVPASKPPKINEDFILDPKTSYVSIRDPNLRRNLVDNGILGVSTGVGTEKKLIHLGDSTKPFSISSYDLLFAYELGLVDSPKKWGGRRKSISKLIDHGTSHDPNFLENYFIYKTLRQKFLFLLFDGSQYGGKWLGYTSTLSDFQEHKSEKNIHSPYIFVPIPDPKQVTTDEIIEYARIGADVNKEVVFVRAKGPRENGILIKPPSDLNLYFIDQRSMGLSLFQNPENLMMKRIIRSHVYDFPPIEFTNRR